MPRTGVSSATRATTVDNVSYINKEAEQYNHNSSLKRKKGSGKLYTSKGRHIPTAAYPLTDEEVRKLRSYFLNSNQKYRYRNYMLVVMAINNGRRCGDILKLRIKDVYNPSTGSVKDKFEIIEQKTYKTVIHGVPINNDMKDAIELYLASLKEINPDEFLFKSRKKGYHYKQNKPKNIIETQVIGIESAWAILQDAKKVCNIKAQGGTHIFRKTYARKYYNQRGQSSKALMELSKSFNHSSLGQTIDYMAITYDNIRDTVMNFSW